MPTNFMTMGQPRNKLSTFKRKNITKTAEVRVPTCMPRCRRYGKSGFGFPFLKARIATRVSFRSRFYAQSFERSIASERIDRCVIYWCYRIWIRKKKINCVDGLSLLVRRQEPTWEIQGIAIFVHNAFNPVGITGILRLQCSYSSAVYGIWGSLHNVNHISPRL